VLQRRATTTSCSSFGAASDNFFCSPVHNAAVPTVSHLQVVRQQRSLGGIDQQWQMEDVDYAIEHCDTDTYILNVDSADRDRLRFPTPAEYGIQFSEPFRMVHGIEVLDASIPNTMYTVDTHNNTLAVVLARLNIFRQVDYLTILEELQTVPEVVEMVDLMQPPQDLVTAGFLVDRDSDSSVPAAASTTSAVMLVRRCTFTGVLVERLHDDTTRGSSSELVFWHEGRRYRLLSPGVAGVGASVLDLTAALLDGRVYMIGDTMDLGLVDMVYYRVFRTTQTFVNFVQDQKLHECFFQTVLLEASIGNYDVINFQEELLTQLRTLDTGIDVRPVSANNVSQRNQFMYTCSSDTGFVFNMKRSGLRVILGFDEFTRADGHSGSYRRISFRDNYQLFGAIFDSTLEKNRITSPGIMDFSGTRYITLHCIELEDIMYSSLAFGSSSTGIGVFKLGSSSNNEVTFLRFDFTKFYKKPFHPVGRLTRLTFRFELPDGTPYDFKGINHNMLILLKYYVPRLRIFNSPSQLNPNYLPDVLAYRSRVDEVGDLCDHEADDADADADADAAAVGPPSSRAESEEDDDEPPFSSRCTPPPNVSPLSHMVSTRVLNARRRERLYAASGHY